MMFIVSWWIFLKLLYKNEFLLFEYLSHSYTLDYLKDSCKNNNKFYYFKITIQKNLTEINLNEKFLYFQK